MRGKLSNYFLVKTDTKFSYFSKYLFSCPSSFSLPPASTVICFIKGRGERSRNSCCLSLSLPSSVVLFAARRFTAAVGEGAGDKRQREKVVYILCPSRQNRETRILWLGDKIVTKQDKEICRAKEILLEMLLEMCFRHRRQNERKRDAGKDDVQDKRGM